MSATGDEIATLRRAFAALAEDAAPRADCPEPERIWAAVGGELDAATIRQVTEHSASCPACAEAWRLARELSFPTAEAKQRPSTLSSRRWRRLALAAAAVLLAAVGLQLRNGVDRTPDTGYRQGEAAGVRSLVPEEEPLARDDFRLRWSGPEGVRWDVWVMTEDLQIVTVARDLGIREYRVSESVLAAVPATTRLLWRVEMILPDGRRETSPTFRSRLQ